MKKYIPLSLVASFVSSVSFAVNPIPGWYGGINGDVSYVRPIKSVYHAQLVNYLNQVSTVTINDKIAYRIMGGGGGQIGYRFMDNYRIEGDVFYNMNYYGYLVINGFKIPYAAKSPTPIPGLTEKGSTSYIAGFINAYYDFFTPGNDNSFVPYVGLGLGYLRMDNKIVFYNDSVEIPNARASIISGTTGAQAIIGASYFLDDYTSIGVDYRYLTTRVVDVFNTRYTANLINFNLNFAFDSSKT